jgi:hypothetical protein
MILPMKPVKEPIIYQQRDRENSWRMRFVCMLHYCVVKRKKRKERKEKVLDRLLGLRVQFDATDLSSKSSNAV